MHWMDCAGKFVVNKNIEKMDLLQKSHIAMKINKIKIKKKDISGVHYKVLNKKKGPAVWVYLIKFLFSIIF